MSISLTFPSENTNRPPKKPVIQRQKIYIAQNLVPISGGDFRIYSSIEQFIPHYSDLRELKSLQQNWNGYESEAPNSSSIQLAQDTLDTLVKMDFLPTRVAPSAEGGVGIVFMFDNKYADIEFLNSGEILAVTSDGKGEPSVWDVVSNKPEIQRALKRIRDYFND